MYNELFQCIITPKLHIANRRIVLQSLEMRYRTAMKSDNENLADIVKEFNLSLAQSKAPSYSIDSPHILTGYRSQMTLAECLLSMFYWHNQTVNIWTSVLLVVFNLWLTIYFTSLTDMSKHFYAMFWFQGALRAFCWYNSWAYHTFVPHSKQAANLACQMDYLGCYLTPLGMGSNLLFLELCGHSSYQIALLCVGGTGIGFAIAVSLLPRYQTEAYRSMRMLISLMSSLPYIAGLVVAVIVTHRGTVPTYYQYLAYGVMCEVVAGTFYVSMFPEISFPGVFDHLLSSHSIWHWLNFGFDACMMLLAYKAFNEMSNEGRC